MLEGLEPLGLIGHRRRPGRAATAARALPRARPTRRLPGCAHRDPTRRRGGRDLRRPRRASGGIPGYPRGARRLRRRGVGREHDPEQRLRQRRPCAHSERRALAETNDDLHEPRGLRRAHGRPAGRTEGGRSRGDRAGADDDRGHRAGLAAGDLQREPAPPRDAPRRPIAPPFAEPSSRSTTSSSATPLTAGARRRDRRPARQRGCGDRAAALSKRSSTEHGVGTRGRVAHRRDSRRPAGGGRSTGAVRARRGIVEGRVRRRTLGRAQPRQRNSLPGDVRRRRQRLARDRSLLRADEYLYAGQRRGVHLERVPRHSWSSRRFRVVRSTSPRSRSRSRAFASAILPRIRVRPEGSR